MPRRAAIYARVATDKQQREQRIESQIVALQVLARAQGYSVSPTQVYLDSGVGGARGDCPGLDRLRDAAMERLFEAVFVYGPERLARRYGYKLAITIEELKLRGCEVLFFERPVAENPDDQLLLITDRASLATEVLTIYRIGQRLNNSRWRPGCGRRAWAVTPMHPRNRRYPRQVTSSLRRRSRRSVDRNPGARAGRLGDR